jgi:hypothetical protein
MEVQRERTDIAVKVLHNWMNLARIITCAKGGLQMDDKTVVEAMNMEEKRN